jgi:hypothetical protein
VKVTGVARKLGLPAVMLGLITVAVLLGSPRACSTLSGHHAAAVEALRACPAAQRLLGREIRAAWVGSSCGSTWGEVVGDAEAYYELAVSGSEGRGNLEYSAARRGGVWGHLSGKLWVDGRSLDVPQSCGGPTAAPCARLASCCALAIKRSELQGICRMLPVARQGARSKETCAALRGAVGAILRHQGVVAPAHCR